MIVIETWMDRDLDLGVGDTTKTHQSGGTIDGHKINLTTFSTKGKGGAADSATWDPGSIGSASSANTTIPVVGAEFGDFVLAEANIDLLGLQLDGYVSASGVVTITLYNNTGGAVNLASMTVKVLVFKVR